MPEEVSRYQSDQVGGVAQNEVDFRSSLREAISRFMDCFLPTFVSP